MTGTTYLASEDSALLRRALRGYSGGSFLEIGAGNGGSLVELSTRFGLVIGTDLARPSMSDWKGAGASYVLAEGATCLRPALFDLVAFNPPYLATEMSDDPAVEGGRGLEVPKAFLREALRVVKRSGRVVFLLNDEAKVEEFEQECADAGFGLERIASERRFFEELVVYSAGSRN
jgi:release factor glutamine methyltransferase